MAAGESLHSNPICRPFLQQKLAASLMLKNARNQTRDMKPTFSKPITGAFTYPELLIIAVVLVIWLGLLFTPCSRPRARGSRINCAFNLRQVGIAYRVWANDHGDKFPWLVSTNLGGTLEYVTIGEVFRHFQIVSNEISNPKILVCHSDSGRSRAGSFNDPFSNTNLSYFIGVDADKAFEQMILSGDRNITGGTSRAGRILALTTNSPAGWGANIHNGNGNIGLADGSVQQLTPSGLRRQVETALSSGNPATLRLAVP
jgi:prepilin-type processing-associated H-X9-DG protein